MTSAFIVFALIYWTGASFVESVLFKQGTVMDAFFRPELGEIALRAWVIVLIFIVLTGIYGKNRPK